MLPYEMNTFISSRCPSIVAVAWGSLELAFKQIHPCSQPFAGVELYGYAGAFVFRAFVFVEDWQQLARGGELKDLARNPVARFVGPDHAAVWLRACQTPLHTARTEKFGVSVQQARDFDFGTAPECAVDEEGGWAHYDPTNFSRSREP